MTIKQQGGIFGRNPTFNDLTAGSGSSIKGSGENITFSVNRTDASTAGALVLRAANGNLSIDSDGADKDILIRTGGSTERARFYGDSGDFSIKGNLVVDSGQGIDFSATSGTGTSELFDDYEEGTFSPTLRGATTDPTQSYLYQFGRYTKIGNRVYVSIVVGLQGAGITVGSGNASIDGLPFAVPSGIQYTSACSVEGRFWQTTNLGAPTSGRFEPGGTTISLWVYENSGGKAGSSTNANAADMDDTARVYLSGFYEV